ncbi:class I SAM-dependent methyltransferase [Carbonactinospora thermoautotrophica]|nr:class I SAM-dependent methyltransferase [Carbonactinospora thermoautotrophica]
MGRENGRVDVEAVRALRGPQGQRLLAALAGYDPADELRLATRLRREYPPGLVAAALTQARLRQRAREKFGADADRMLFTPAGLEQATRKPVAEYRAGRYAAAGLARVVDLCCGIGGDLLAFVRAGLAVLGVDRDPVTAAVAAANAEALGLADRVEVRCAEVTEVDPAGYGAVFCDPARRDERGRVFDPEAYSPPWSYLLGLADRVPETAVKVAPGIPHELVPEGAEAEWISYRGEVKEAALWFGALASARRRATLLPGGHTLTERDLPEVTVGPPGRYLYEPDGAVIRAHLVGHVAAQVDGRLLDPTIAYVASDRLVPTPFATAYEVTDVLPFQLKRLRALLRERGVGVLTIKKRGSALEPDRLRRQLRLTGDSAAVLILTRVAGAPTALLARPASQTGRGGSGKPARAGPARRPLPGPGNEIAK